MNRLKSKKHPERNLVIIPEKVTQSVADKTEVTSGDLQGELLLDLAMMEGKIKNRKYINNEGKEMSGLCIEKKYADFKLPAEINVIDNDSVDGETMDTDVIDGGDFNLASLKAEILESNEIDRRNGLGCEGFIAGLTPDVDLTNDDITGVRKELSKPLSLDMGFNTVSIRSRKEKVAMNEEIKQMLKGGNIITDDPECTLDGYNSDWVLEAKRMETDDAHVAFEQIALDSKVLSIMRRSGSKEERQMAKSQYKSAAPIRHILREQCDGSASEGSCDTEYDAPFVPMSSSFKRKFNEKKREISKKRRLEKKSKDLTELNDDGDSSDEDFDFDVIKPSMGIVLQTAEVFLVENGWTKEEVRSISSFCKELPIIMVKSIISFILFNACASKVKSFVKELIQVAALICFDFNDRVPERTMRFVNTLKPIVTYPSLVAAWKVCSKGRLVLRCFRDYKGLGSLFQIFDLFPERKQEWISTLPITYLKKRLTLEASNKQVSASLVKTHLDDQVFESSQLVAESLGGFFVSLGIEPSLVESLSEQFKISKEAPDLGSRKKVKAFINSI